VKVKILQDRLIQERLYKAGDEAEFEDDLAKQLIKQSFAEKVKEKRTKKEKEEVDING